MIKFIQSVSSDKIAEIEKGSVMISSACDILDIMGEVSYHDCGSIIIHSDGFSKEFFDFNTGKPVRSFRNSQTTGCVLQ